MGIHHTIMLACNDHRNGRFKGSFDAAELLGLDGDRLMAFEGPPIKARFWLRSKCGAPPSFSVTGRNAGLPLRIWLHAENYRQWYGNWCWDAFFVQPETAAKFLHVVRIAKWHCYEAESGLFALWREPGREPVEEIGRRL